MVMGGADLHEILAVCDHEIEDARERILKQLDWSLDQFKRELQQSWPGSILLTCPAWRTRARC